MMTELTTHSLRKGIVDIFLRAGQNPVSGEQLSQSLGVSRTAVWKQIQWLEEWGFQFEASRRVGYRLIQAPDELMQPLVKPHISTASDLGHTILWEPERASTNATAVDLARTTDLEHGTVVTTAKQVGGRGRQGRIWQSPQGGMWFSVLVRKPCAVSLAADLTLLASIAVWRALAALGVDARIKWPNDILLNDRKICGILAQMRTDGEEVEYAVIGIGINANFHRAELPAETAEIATTIQTELGHPIHRPTLLGLILAELSALYGALRDGQGFSSVREEWKAHAHTLGRQIRVRVGDGVLTGVAEGIDERGCLQLRDGVGTLHQIHSGEVLFSNAEKV